MTKVLVFKTSANETVKRLFEEISGQEVHCLIQASQLDIFQKKYPQISFINIEREAFYDIEPAVLDGISDICFDEVYITFSGLEGFNYENVLSILRGLEYKNAFFYNANGDKVLIPKDNIIVEKMIRLYLIVRNKRK